MNDIPDSELPIWLVAFIPLAFFVFFPLMWCFVLWMLSHVGGWSRLAARYRSKEAPLGKRWTGVQGNVGFVSYRGVLECTTNEEGMFLQPGLIFRFSHPLLFIPWTEFREARRSTILWLRTVRANVGSPRVARIRLAANVFEESEGRRVLD